MAAAVDDGIGVEELRTEIERLSRELDLASTEKIQSAQYGLALLEEKSALQQRCNDLEALYENTKHELEITQEVSAAEIFRHLSSVRLPIHSTHPIVHRD
jgi:protein bicaudal D